MANKQLTREEYKKAMRALFTERRDVVQSCGHKFDKYHEPNHRNCLACWFAYFQVNGQITQISEECFHKEGKEVLIKLKGEKFVKFFLIFMSMIAQIQEKNEGNGVTQTSVGSLERNTEGQTESNRTNQDETGQTV